MIPPSPVSRAVTVAALASRRRAMDRPYLEALRIPSLSVGLYELPAGSEDPQRPHREDEVYYVLQGHAVLRVEGEDHPVGPGSVVLVRAGEEHRFREITEDLSVLVFFAPAEST